ncbi:AMP-binding protein [Candidatus Protochlamydia amoebophila]|nr:AMP-binding protein [Candidatus Protochlamydia amoebophila]
MKIDWISSESRVFLNPSYGVEKQQFYLKILKKTENLDSHFWLSTSGSTSQKWVGLSKKAILASAESVNKHIEANFCDRWVTALPDFHVGGLGIWARAFLSDSQVFDFKTIQNGKWDPKIFWSFLRKMKGTLTALVPTQIYDLVQLALPAPNSLRAVIVGGGRLLPDLYKKAVELGWPLMPSYGLTECCSQVATATLGSWQFSTYPSLQILTHISVRERDGHLEYKSPSLLTCYAYFEQDQIYLHDPKVEGWFRCGDLGNLQGNILNVKGRSDHLLKIGGESVDLSQLEAHLESILLKNSSAGMAVLVAVPDERLGNILYLAVEQNKREILKPLIDLYQQTVLPFERIRNVIAVENIPRSPLGKILKIELIKLITLNE